MQVAAFIGRRLLYLLVILLIVTSLTFLITNALPGDPAAAILGQNSATPTAIAAVRKQLGLNQSVPVRYVHWLGHAVRGDFGFSYRTGQTVSTTIKNRLPVTIELLVLSQLLALAGAIPLALIAAYRRGRAFDHFSAVVLFGGLSAPQFVLGMLLIYVFAVRSHVLPASGYVPLSESVVGNLKSMVLPTVTLSIGAMTLYQRLLRSDAIETLQQDFIVLAKTKGLPVWKVLLRHALRPSTLSLMTIFGLVLGASIGGAVVVEQLFGLPGIGSLLVAAVGALDYVMVQALVTLIAVAYVVVNVSTDLLHMWIDPRIRTTRA